MYPCTPVLVEAGVVSPSIAAAPAATTRTAVDTSSSEAFRTLWHYLVLPDRPRSSDVIFCFGSLDLRVPIRAAELFHRGVAPRVVVTGGPPAPGEPPEGDVFADRLVADGVPAERIVIERRSRHTGENVVLGMAAAADGQVPVRRAALVAWPLALRRCRATFAHHFPDVRTFPLSAGNSFRVFRGATGPGDAALDELERIRTYGRSGLMVPQVIPPAVERAAAALQKQLVRT